MRIDASNLLIAAQLQPQRPLLPVQAPTVKAAPKFEPLPFAGATAGPDRRPAALPGAPQRPGMQLDIKV